MIIKQQALPAQLRQKLAAVYILFGQDYFLLNEAAESIKQAWKAANGPEIENTILTINNSSDWVLAAEELRNYSLFASAELFDLRYEKKNLEVAAKNFLDQYLINPNPKNLLLIRCPNLNLKQLQGLSHSKLQLVQITALTIDAMQKWISKKLQSKQLKFEAEIPELIHQYTQGNMLACSQIIEKIELISKDYPILTQKLIKDQLIDQSNFSIFELADACLSSKPEKLLRLLRYACQTKVEPTLTVWILSQEIRLLIQLIDLTTMQGVAFNTACNKLKIWSQRSKLYQGHLNKISLDTLMQLLQYCKIIDERIKLNQNNQIWEALEQVALSLCLGINLMNRST